MVQPQVQTTQEGMLRARQEFEQKVGTFNQALGSVNQEMAVLQSTWVGTASTNFNQAMDSWEAGFRTVISELIGMIESMGGNASAYATQEEDNAQVAANFSSALPNAVADPASTAPAGLPGI